MIDTDSARRFVQEHARLIDRRRFEHLLGGGPASLVVTAVAAYANPDGGYAGVIEPDTRSTSSQPIAALTAFEVLGEAGAQAPRAALDWLASIAEEDGGVPFSLPATTDAPHAPWMAPSPGSSLHMTSAVLGAALRLGAEHEWVDAATAFCRAQVDARDDLTAYETKYALEFLDATGDEERASRVLDGMPPDGRIPVPGGVEGETLGLLKLAPHPGRFARRPFSDEQVRTALDEFEAEQHDDGGWDFDWLAWSPAITHEWRGRLTVDAVALLKTNNR